jgi:hypothetical protein
LSDDVPDGGLWPFGARLAPANGQKG